MRPLRSPVVPLRRRADAVVYRVTPATLRRERDAARARYEASARRLADYEALARAAAARHHDLAEALALAEHRYLDAIASD